MAITKLILPVAGLGKRLQPLTFTTPKNLIQLNGKPLIEYALDEAVQAGIREVVIIISPDHREKYEEYIGEAQRRYPDLKFYLREQAQPWGHGHALLQAEDLIGSEPFAVRFCDDVIVDSQPTLPRLIGQYQDLGSSVIFLERVPKENVSRYGVVEAEELKPQIYQLKGMVEKPAVEVAPSNLIVIGGYVLQPEIMESLQRLQKGMIEKNDALLISDALIAEMNRGGNVYGWEFPGVRLDCGTLDGLQYAESYMAQLIDAAKVQN